MATPGLVTLEGFQGGGQRKLWCFLQSGREAELESDYCGHQPLVFSSPDCEIPCELTGGEQLTWVKL